MSEWFYKTLSWFAGCLLIAFFFGLAVFLSHIEIKDMDLWLHLAAGRHIFETLSIPMSDMFSCTLAHSPWINHEWLFQTIVYAVYSAAGIDGLINLKAVIVFLTFVVLLHLGYSRERQLWPVVILLLVLLVYQVRLTLRPDMFSLLFFALYMSILGLYLDQCWSLLAVALVQIVWTNTHGFFILGPGVVFTALAGEWLKRHARLPFQWNAVSRLSDEEFNRLKLVFAVAVCSCLINPYFIHGALYPFHVLFTLGGESKIFFNEIQELQRPLAWDSLFSPQPYLPYKLLILISFLSFVLNYRKIDVQAVMLWAVFLVFSLIAVRNIVFFAFTAYFVVLANLQFISFKGLWPARWDSEQCRASVSLAFKIFLMLGMIHYADRLLLLRGYFDFDKFEQKSEFGGVSLRNFPYKAADFLVDNGIKGNFLNDFNSGAYLVGRAYPDVKVFID